MQVLRSSQLLQACVALTASFAFFITPLTPLLVPLLARQNAWPAQGTGWVMGCYALGMATVALFVLWRGAHRRPGILAVLGIAVASGGTMLLAGSTTLALACTAAAVCGVGTATFSTHLGPIFVAAAPREYMARLQSIMVLAQSLPLLAANPLIGLLTTASSARTAMICWSIGSGLVAVASLFSRELRQVRSKRQDS